MHVAFHGTAVSDAPMLGKGGTSGRSAAREPGPGHFYSRTFRYRARGPIALALAVLVVAAASRASWAQDQKSNLPRKLTVFVLQEAPGTPPRSSARLTRVIVEEARKQGITVKTVNSSFADTALLLGCEPGERECQARILDQVGSDQVIHGEVAPVDRYPGSLTVSLTVVRRDGEATTHQITVPADDADRSASELGAAMPGVLGVPVVESPTSAPADEGSPTGGRFRLDRKSWALVGSGIALVSLGGVLWVTAGNLQNDIDNAPTATVADLDNLASLEDRARLRANVGNLFVAAGFIAASAGIIRAVIMHRRTAAESGPAPTTDVAPMPVQGGAGVMLILRR